MVQGFYYQAPQVVQLYKIMQGKLKFILARYMEDVSWAKDLDHVVIQKGVDMPNIGREPASYFYYLITHDFKADPEGTEYVFTQANPFDHVPDFLDQVSRGESYFGDELICDYQGNPHHGGLPIDQVMGELGMDVPGFIKFKPACLFKLSREEILRHDLPFYLRCFALCCMNKEYPYVFERIFPLVFDLNKV